MYGEENRWHADYPCELHAHTNRSDGNDTPWELLRNAAACGIKILALTDHDVLPPELIELPDGTERNPVDAARELGVILLPGVEFSCETEVEDVHVVGLGCDWKKPALKEQEADIVRSKTESYVELIHRLDGSGYSMTLEEVLSLGNPPVPVEKLQKKRIFDTMAAKGYTKDWAQAKLLVRDSPALNVKRRKPEAASVIRLIHDAGGIAVLAHPCLIDETVTLRGRTLSRWDYVETLIGAGLDSIEVRYTYNKTSCKDKRAPELIWQEVRERMEGRLFLSGGSDYHADYKKGVASPRELGECGLTMEEFMEIPALRRLAGM